MHKHTLKMWATVLLVSFVFVACATDEKPDHILSQAEIVPVLKDLEIAYTGVDQTVKDPKERQAKYEEMNSLVLKKYKLEKNEFYTSFKWYESQPALMDSLFKQVIKSLNIDLVPLQNQNNMPPIEQPN